MVVIWKWRFTSLDLKQVMRAKYLTKKLRERFRKCTASKIILHRHIFLTIPSRWSCCISLFRGEILMAYRETYRDVKRTLKNHWYYQILSHESLENRNTNVKNLEFSRTLIYFPSFFSSFLCDLFLGKKKLWGKPRVLSLIKVGKSGHADATLRLTGSGLIRFFAWENGTVNLYSRLRAVSLLNFCSRIIESLKRTRTLNFQWL